MICAPRSRRCATVDGSRFFSGIFKKLERCSAHLLGPLPNLVRPFFLRFSHLVCALQKEEAGYEPTDAEERNKRFLYGFMIASFVFTGIVWLLIIIMRNRIILAANMFKEASKALGRMPQVRWDAWASRK